jgi:uncharacterized membrane protein
VLIERVRSAIGRAASHPGSIEVDARDGVVTVSGPILADEADALLDTVARVRGVRDVVDRLDVRASSGNTPGLQGAGRRDERRMGGDRDDWSPTARIAAGAFALGLGAVALQRRMPLGVIVGGLGAGLLARSATNLPARRLTGVGGGRRAIDVHKTVHLNASVDMVFDFWSNWQNFPRFMTNVREVRDLGGGRSHWVVAGPAGNVSWDAELTAYEPNRRIAWKSVPGSIVQHAGFVRFQPGEDGRGTRLDIQISYNPPGGAIGHALARVFGADPKSEMDADLMRMKTFIETGKTPHDAAQPSTIGMSCPLS